jgi:hypothetical protein
MNHVSPVALRKRNAKTFLLYISIMIQSSVDFVCILPELTMLILINVFILFVLGFSAYSGKTMNSEHIDFRLGYQITPQISQPLCNMVVLSLLFTLGLYTILSY